MKILILNGPNLNMLGKRQPEIYGNLTLERLINNLREKGKSLKADIDHFQSNIEGELVNMILSAQNNFDGIVFNPAAYTHTSIALKDALESVKLPCIEVHISNTALIEDFRHTSLTASACIGQIMGLGYLGYELALEGLVKYLSQNN
jgi:3-dehydroquinate dehydratase II